MVRGLELPVAGGRYVLLMNPLQSPTKPPAALSVLMYLAARPQQDS